MLFLILSFASGLFVPLSQLPRLVQQIAPYLPTYRLGQLAWNAIGAWTDPLSTSVAWLAGYGIVFAVIALRSYWREEQRAFG
jgi:ABC-2 type transport system permease protein